MVFKSKGLRFLGFISSKISPSDSPFFLLLLFSPPPPSSFSESRWFSYPQDFLGFCFIFPTPPPRIFLTFLVVFLPTPQGFAWIWLHFSDRTPEDFSSSSWVWCFGAPPGDDFCTLFPGFRVFLVFWTLSRDTFRTILCRHPWFSWILLCFSYSSCINILGFRVQLLGFQVQRSKVFRV